LNEVARVDFRRKIPDRPANWYNATLTLRDGSTVSKDWWHLADGDWGAGFFMDAACNFCDDVTAETADVSFGDAWVEPYSSDGRGTNVVVVRSKELKEVIEGARADGRLILEPVDAEFIVRTQAAGLRHRRDGLAYRLTLRRRPEFLRKRVDPSADLPLRRKLVYRLRYGIAQWSHRWFRLARSVGAPRIYTAWARVALRLYQSVTWSRGRLGRLLDALLPQPEA
jgi:coenzyme F420-reducing hydrogenase beta subunit